jgi:hypothetical protein
MRSGRDAHRHGPVVAFSPIWASLAAFSVAALTLGAARADAGVEIIAAAMLLVSILIVLACAYEQRLIRRAAADRTPPS